MSAGGNTATPVLSVLMPVYNEQARLERAVAALAKAGLPVDFELVAVDDGSTDTSGTLADELAARHPWMRVIHHPANRGKGAAIRTALAAAEGTYACIYDADLEYDPRDIPALLAPLTEGTADAVYGVRNFGGTAAHSFWYVMGNRAVTTACNVLFNRYLRDIMTCFKVMPLELFRSLGLTADGFDLEAEITARLLARGVRVYEVPISYAARSRAEGKKLTASDAFGVLATLARIRLGARRD